MSRTPCIFRWKLLPRVRFSLNHRVYHGVTVKKKKKTSNLENVQTFPCTFLSVYIAGSPKTRLQVSLTTERKEELRGTPETKEISLIFIFSVYCCVTTRPYFHFSELPTRPSTEKFEKPREKDNSKFIPCLFAEFSFPCRLPSPITLSDLFWSRTKRLH